MDLTFLNNLTLICSDGQLSVNSWPLCMASEVFAAMLANSMVEKNQAQIKLEQFSMAVVDRIYKIIQSPTNEDLLKNIDASQTISSIRFCHLYQLKQLLPYFVRTLARFPLTTEIVELNQQLTLVDQRQLLSRFFVPFSLPVFDSADIYYQLYKIAFEFEDIIIGEQPPIVLKAVQGLPPILAAFPKAPVPPAPKAPVPAAPKAPLVIKIRPINILGMSTSIAKVTDSLIKSTVINLCPREFFNIVGHPIPDVVVSRYVLKLQTTSDVINFYDKHNWSKIKSLVLANKDINSLSGLDDQIAKQNDEVTKFKEKRADAKRPRTDD